jgi:hypothetical protein
MTHSQEDGRVQAYHPILRGAQSQPTDNAALADTGLAYEDGLQTHSAPQHLPQSLNLLFSADDGVEFALPGQLGQVAPEAVQGGGLGLALLGLAFAAFALGHVMPQQVEDLFAHVFQFQPQVHQDLGGHPLLLTQEAEQQVFGAHMVLM